MKIKLLLGLLMLSVIAGAGSTYVFYKESVRLEEQNIEKTEEIASLNDRIDLLIEKKDALSEELDEKTAQAEELHLQVETLNETVSDLQQQLNRLALQKADKEDAKETREPEKSAIAAIEEIIEKEAKKNGISTEQQARKLLSEYMGKNPQSGGDLSGVLSFLF